MAKNCDAFDPAPEMIQVNRYVAIWVVVLLGIAAPFLAASAGEEATALPSGAAKKHAYTNRLIDSNDPYLLLHAHNPVDWYPWGAEALAKAKRENRPIFVSVGYSTCYWCHVAERTIYSNPDIAKLMNQWFVNITTVRLNDPCRARESALARAAGRLRLVPT